MRVVCVVSMWFAVLVGCAGYVRIGVCAVRVHRCMETTRQAQGHVLWWARSLWF